jgi:hypothetical protein
MSQRNLVRAASLILAVALLLATFPAGQAQTVSDYEVKAAYLYSLAKFVDWPARTFPNAAAPMRFCVLNDHSFQSQLMQTVQGKSIAGHSIEVLQVRDAEQSRDCQVLFVNALQSREIRHIAEVLQGASVLTIGEKDGFLEDGGIVNFVLQNSRVQFEVNIRAANEGGLYVSSRLLKVARRVLE